MAEWARGFTGKKEMLGNKWRWSLHKTLDVVNLTELLALKFKILLNVNLTSIN